MKSDEGHPCVNTVEKAYLGLLVIVFALGIISLFRLSHFKAELLKVFDSRQGFTFFIHFITKIDEIQVSIAPGPDLVWISITFHYHN